MISSNILIYNENFLNERLSIVKYTITKYYSYSDLGNFVKESRVLNKEVPIFQYGRNIYSLYEMKIPLKLKEMNVFPEKIKINLENDNESKELLGHLVGETIATQLRNHESKKWRADLGYGLVYHVTNLVASNEFDPLFLWYGFRYSPIVFDDGRVGIIVDPRFKVYWRKNLRNLIEKNHKLIPDFGNVVIDICPDDSCILKSDPFSVCDLSKHGKTAVLIDFNYNKTPKTATFEYKGEEIDILSYNNNVACPLKRMGGFIKEESPIAKIRYGSSSRIYSCPLERLRKFAEFSDIVNPQSRRYLMSLIQPPPSKRFEETDKIVKNLLSTINFKPILLTSKGMLDSTFMSEFSIQHCEPIKLVLNNNKHSRNPAMDLEEEKPFDFSERNFNGVKAHLILIGLDKKEKTDLNYFINTILEGEGGNLEDTIIPSLKDYVSLENVEISDDNLEICYNDNQTIIENKINEYLEKEEYFHNSEGNQTVPIILRIYGKEAEKINTEIIQDHLIAKDIPNQGISIKSLVKVSEDWGKSKGYFKNIYLGIYSKIGGIVWSLPEKSLSEKCAYFGYSSIFRDDKIFSSLTEFNDRGLWIKGYSFVTGKDDFKSRLLQVLTENFSIQEKEKIVFHIRGRLKEYLEFDAFKEIFIELEKHTMFIEFTSSPIRLYEHLPNGIVSPKSGTRINLSSDQTAMLTYYFKTTSKTPDPILCRFIMGDINQFEKETENAFKLTQCYCGYLRHKTKFPITAYSAEQMTQKIINFQNCLDREYKSQWYI